MKRKIGNLFLVILTNILIINYAYSASLSVKVNPKEVALGENFILEFHIETELDGDPEISFNAPNADIVGQTGKRVSSSSTYINGSWESKREIIIGYELSPKRSGKIFINQIKVAFNGETLTHRMVFADILSKPGENPKIFGRVELSKDEAFVGESVIAKYYLYYKVPVRGNDIKKFPVFNNFIKRMHEIRERDEAVSYNGEVYNRMLVYALQLYPQKPGELNIDPIILNVTYLDRSRDRFGMGMGFGLSSAKKRTVSSETKKLKVYALPTGGISKNFLGLVDHHDIKLEVNRTKFLVNEPIELKLTVTGPGALEKLDPPSLITSDKVEEFETTSELQKISSNFTAIKTMNYTYLARSPGVIAEELINFSYFHPESNSYKEIQISLPQFVIEGTVAKAKSGNPQSPATRINNSKNQKIEINRDLKLLSPFGANTFSTINIYNYFHGIFVVILIGLISFFMKKQGTGNFKIFKNKKINEFEYSSFIQMMAPAVKRNPGKSIPEIIAQLEMSNSAKEYFDKMYKEMENDYFNQGKSSKKSYKIERNFLNQLEKCLDFT